MAKTKKAKNNNEKSNMEILIEIRNKRNQELAKQKRTDISVVKIEFFGEGKQTGNKIFRSIEKQEFKDKPAELCEKFYISKDGVPELVAVKTADMDEMLPVGINGDEKESWNAEKADIEQCIEDREKQLKIIAKKLGISEEEIIGLSEIDLEQEIEEKSAEKAREEEKKGKEDSDEKEETRQISEKEAKAISAGNEIMLNTLVDTKGTTLGKTIGLEGYTKIMVVHAYRLTEMQDAEGNKGKRGIMKFGFIAQKQDGTYETIPESKLRMYRGDNKEITGINNPEEVETRNNDSIFEVVGTNKKLAIRQSDPYGRPEVYLAQSTHDNSGNMAQQLQDKYDGTDRTDVEVRDLFRKNQGEYQIDEMQEEYKQHKEAGCDEKNMDIDEFDGDLSTGFQHEISVDSVLEYGGVKMSVAEIASLPRFKISPEEFVENYNQCVLTTKDEAEHDLDAIYDEIEEIVNEQYRNPQNGPLQN